MTVHERTAIVHDWFQGYHGSERTVEAMRAGLFAPGNQPDVYTFSAARELLPPALADRIVRESRLARLPGLRQVGHNPGRWRLLLPYMARYFARLDLSAYDLVVSSSHAFASSVRPRSDAAHVVYCYTPARYLWLTGLDARRGGPASQLGLALLGERLRRLDREAAQRADSYVAISSAVRERIARFYDRDASVIPPPVDVADFGPPVARARRDVPEFVWAGRLVAYKQPERVVELFRTLPFRLTMIGIGPLEQRLRARLPDNVRLLGWLDRPAFAEELRRADGLVHLAEEDFGIVMAEALAAGTPVVALDRGGAPDIVRDGKDGFLVGDGLEEQRDALQRLVAREWDRAALRRRAEGFSRERFVERLASHLELL
jgi:glycosyltransferase involved in cell wall biosynthesis